VCFFYQSGKHQDPQTQHTYVCDDTLDPSFLGQKFVFKINEEAATEPRQYRIRIVVKTRENLRVNRFLGMADIHLTCLRNEQEIEVRFIGFL
jgi:C2 domain